MIGSVFAEQGAGGLFRGPGTANYFLLGAAASVVLLLVLVRAVSRHGFSVRTLVSVAAGLMGGLFAYGAGLGVAEAVNSAAGHPLGPQPEPTNSPVFFVLCLALVAGSGYVATVVTNWLAAKRTGDQLPTKPEGR